MRSGTKNALVDIMRNIEGPPDPELNTPTFTPVSWREDVFANVVARRSSEATVEGQTQASITMRFEFDYYDVEGITSEDWILGESGEEYAIIGLLPDLSGKQHYVVDATLRMVATGRT